MFGRPSTRQLAMACVAVLTAFASAKAHAQQAASGRSSNATATDTMPQALAVGGGEIVRAIARDEQHVYSFTLRAGELARAVVDQRGVDVIVSVRGPDGVQIVEVDSPNGDRGPEPVEFVAPRDGAYRLLVQPIPDAAIKPEASYAVRLTAVISAAQHAIDVARERAVTDTTISWIAANAMPIRSVLAGSGFAELQPLKSVFRDARIVGLGEATHGSREFFQFKHRMLEFLVREMGFRVFAMEASLSAAENVIDPYVQGGRGEVNAVLASQGFWTWNTEEVRDLLSWMRAYNQSVSPAQRVHFVGIDIQINSEAREMLLSYLRGVSPDYVSQAAAVFGVNVDSLAWIHVSDTTEMRRVRAQLVEAKRGYDDLFAFVTANGARFAAMTSPAEGNKALRYARVLAEHADAYSKTDMSETVWLRDKYMAENVRRLLVGMPADTRVMLWAHNAHIQHTSGGNISNALGYRLQQAYGPAYYAIGFSFGGGAFQAQDCARGAELALTEFRIAPPEGSIDWLLGRAADRIGAAMFFIDLKGHVLPPPAHHWFASPHGMLSIGSIFQRDWPASAYRESTVLSDAFDGVVYFQSTTRARPLPSQFFVGRFCQ